MAGITTHRSNQLETLIAPLAKALYGSADPFSRRIVLVPHIMMRQWIQRELVERIPSGGVAGVEWMLLDQGLAMLASGLNAFCRVDGSSHDVRLVCWLDQGWIL